MRKFMVVQGRPGLLVGSPFSANRFIGQSKKVFEDGQMPNKLHERFYPIRQAVPFHRDIFKAAQKNMLWLIGVVTAKGPDEAMELASRLSKVPMPDRWVAPKKEEPKPAPQPQPELRYAYVTAESDEETEASD